MKTVEEIKRLVKCGNEVSEFINKTLPALRKRFKDGESTLDKHKDGWSIDGDMIQSINVKLSYSSFSGYYGNSSTYSDIKFDRALFVKYFIKYLNEHNNEIFNEIADNMIIDAKLLKDSAMTEIDELRKQIDQI